MALGKYARVDGRKPSSNYCSIVTLIMFVAICLVGVWMMKSSSMVPFQYLDFSSQESETELKKMTENDSQQFEDNRGDLLEDAMKGDGITVADQHESNSDVKKKQNLPEKTNENAIEESQEEKSVKESVDRNTRSEESSNNKNENDRNRNSENEETNIEDKKEISAAAETENKGGGGETTNTGEEKEFKEGLGEKSKLDKGERKSDMEKAGEIHQEDKVEDHTEEVEQNQEKGSKQDQVLNEVFPSGAQSELLNETTAQLGGWSTQSVESKNEKEEQQSLKNKHQNEYNWKLCNVTSGSDYIPCLDNIQAIRKLPSTMHYEHRERHCPEESPTCLVPLPEKYKRPIEWPESREKIWYYNVPHTKLAEFKGHQNWVKVTGSYLTFPGGGTQFKHGALRYIDFIQGSVPDIAWGKRSRVILDVGCGVASFGGFLFERDVLTMSFAPKDEHEAQVQFALERGIPAISAVMGTKRLPFPGMVFDIVHCARCRVPWHIEGGKLLLELNRLLRPGGFFVWSATPVYQKRKEEDVEIWKAMSKLTKSMCWELLTIKKDKVNGVGAAIYRKPTSNDCYERREQNEPPLCQESDDLNAAWNVALQACMHKVPVEESERGSHWPKEWPARLNTPPYWLKSSQVGVYGKSAPEDFVADYEHWKHVVSNSYLNGMGINWSSVRNVMDMRSLYGGFAAALRDMKVWVMNVVPIDSPDTLPIIYERGLFGIYHDWCESFSTYPRSYDLLHADHLFSKLVKRCNLVAMMAEVDRILRPGGKLIVRDHDEIIGAVEMLARSLRWEIRLTYSKNKEGLLCIEKTMWRPTEVETIASAIA